MTRLRRVRREALEEARGVIVGQALGRVGGMVAVRPLLMNIERAIGSTLGASPTHDAGAIAQCSFCGRYSAAWAALSDMANTRAPCDCGKLGGWSGSFKAPGPDAAWSVGVNRR